MSLSQAIFPKSKTLAGLSYNTATGFVGDFFIEPGQAILKLALRSGGDAYASCLDALLLVSIDGTSTGGVTGTHIKSSLSAIIPAKKDVLLKLLEALRDKDIIGIEEVSQAKFDLRLTQAQQFRQQSEHASAAHI